jgi:hypothetical protein
MSPQVACFPGTLIPPPMESLKRGAHLGPRHVALPLRRTHPGGWGRRYWYAVLRRGANHGNKEMGGDDAWTHCLITPESEAKGGQLQGVVYAMYGNSPFLWTSPHMSPTASPDFLLSSNSTQRVSPDITGPTLQSGMLLSFVVSRSHVTVQPA